MKDKLLYEDILNEYSKKILDAFYDGIYITDEKGKTLYINSAYEKISGLKKELLIGKKMDYLVNKKIISKSATLTVLKTGNPCTINQQFKTGKSALVSSTPICDNKNRIIAVVTSVRDISELVNLKSKINEDSKRIEKYRKELKEIKSNVNIKTNIVTEEMVETLYLAERASKVDSTVLLLGETGVGKEAFANSIYQNSLRAKGRFVKVNCATLPENLIESELFGYEKGSFTGAMKEGKAGIFERANGGTIFLDEIGEMPLNLQTKLLRVLQEHKITRIGGLREIDVDVRIIAATNRDLAKMIKEKNFRQDLYYRLNVIPITIPPLRDRGNDVILLAKYFLDYYNRRYGYSKKVSSGVMDSFICYSWPGNVRELKNTIERMVVISVNDTITIDDLPKGFLVETNYMQEYNYENISLKEATDRVEYEMISNAYDRYKNVRMAAESLGIDASTFVRKRKKLECCNFTNMLP